jgi:hypothetical protein
MLCNLIPEYSHFLPINPIVDAIFMNALLLYVGLVDCLTIQNPTWYLPQLI